MEIKIPSIKINKNNNLPVSGFFGRIRFVKLEHCIMFEYFQTFVNNLYKLY